MTARWEEALDALLDLYTSHGTPDMVQYVEGWTLAEEERKRVLELRGACERIRAGALAADPIWVDGDMQTVWEAAIDSFEPEPLSPTDLLVPNGFVYLARPHISFDVHGRRISERGYLWSSATLMDPETKTTTPGVAVLAFHCVGDSDDYEVNGWAQKPKPEEGLFRIPFPNGTLTIDHLYPWAFGTNGKGRFADLPEGVTSVEKQIQSLWRLMQQHISEVSRHDAPRAFRRRWERAKLNTKQVVVIKLRRPYHEPDDEHEPRLVDWTHRWIVGGHWRNQPYPSEGLHRQIWISPYVKGPEDKPLELRRAHVFELVR